MTTLDLLTGLPGEDLIRQGLVDYANDRRTIPSCLVSISLPRLHRAGLIDSHQPEWSAYGELQLYRLLRQAGNDAYSHYNALVRQLISFEQALDHRCTRNAVTGESA